MGRSKKIKHVDELTNAKVDETQDTRLTSECWILMVRLHTEDKSETKAKCNYCGEIFTAASSSGTSHLRRHANKCTKRYTKELRNYYIGVDNTIDKDGNREMKMMNPSVNFEKLREAVCMYVVSGGHPFTTIEEPGFRYMIAIACPGFKPISRYTLRRDAIKSFTAEKNLLELELENIPGKVCFTTDNWRNDHTDDEYICITAHWIDNSWKLQKRIIRFGALTPPFGGLNIADDISLCLSQWKIDHKVFTFTLDNASYNDTMISHLKNQYLRNQYLLNYREFFHVRCSCHIINLIVQAGLKLVHDVVGKVRTAVKHIKASIPKLKRFYELAETTYHLNTRKKLRGDCKVRWNLTYLMLDRVIYFKSVLDHFFSRDGDMKGFSLSEDEWIKVSSIHDFLKVFYDVTTRFSASKYPTANIFFMVIWEIQKHLIEAAEGIEEFLSLMVKDMHAKFDKYWRDYNMVLACAAAFDPRYKIDYVEYCYGSLCGDECAREAVHVIKETLYDMFKSYTEQRVYSDIGNQENSNMEGNGDKVAEIDDYETFLRKKRRTFIEKSELDLYLEEKNSARTNDFDILLFWADASARFPTLATMARDILAIPISSVPSESAFSMGKKLVTPWRASLAPETVKTLALYEDWLRAKGFSYGPSILTIGAKDNDDSEEVSEGDE